MEFLFGWNYPPGQGFHKNLSDDSHPRSTIVPLLFVITLFASASLLFMVQPMVGRMVLPLMGGSPAVWNACMVFFQALLLIGYLYADRLTNRIEPKRQWLVHVVVLSLPVLAMAAAVLIGPKNSPIAIVESLADETRPIIGVLALLMVAIGIPFFVASTSAPLLQKWFAFTGHPSARDPYFLYAASNAGSLISLLGYPILIEPNLGLTQQAWLFGGGFVVLIALIVLCGRAAANPAGAPPPAVKGKGPKPSAIPTENPVDAAPPTLLRKLKWLALSFVPSSLMLGVTFYMTTDIASIPLLWVIPLALYLVTFIIAFGRVPGWFRLVIGNLAPVMILLLVFLMISGVEPGTGVELLVHLLTFFATALMCHYELALDRPPAKYLTNYYLWISLGGVLGGIFNAIIAPVVFPLAFEYPITLVLACFLVPTFAEEKPQDQPYDARPSFWSDPMGCVLGRIFPGGYNRRAFSVALDILFPVLMGLILYLMRFELPRFEWFYSFVRDEQGNITQFVGVIPWIAKRFIADKENLGKILVTADTVKTIIIYAVPIMICFFFVERPVRFALSVAVILGFNEYLRNRHTLLHSERTFFGILKIRDIEADRGHDYGYPKPSSFRSLTHGTTLHGQQYRYRQDPVDVANILGSASVWDSVALAGGMYSEDLRQLPLTYYHRTGPVGAMFRYLNSKPGGKTADYAMVGLGTGSVSCYANPGQKLTFYEIDPTVIKLVVPPQYFTYVDDAKKRGATVDFKLGDARIQLQKDPNAKYALLLVDAFSSDSIPVHLLTVEAVQMYMDKLTDDGFLALHISNKFVRLEPVVAAIAQKLGLTAWVWNSNEVRLSDGLKESNGKSGSSWVVLAKDPKQLGDLHTPAGELLAIFEAADLLEDIIALEAIGNTFDRENDARLKLNQKPYTIAELEAKLAEKDKAKADLLGGMVRRHSGKAHLAEVMVKEYGHAFRPVESLDGVKAWTDDYADVLQVMTIREVQWLRRLFGISTPVKE